MNVSPYNPLVGLVGEGGGGEGGAALGEVRTERGEGKSRVIV